MCSWLLLDILSALKNVVLAAVAVAVVTAVAALVSAAMSTVVCYYSLENELPNLSWDRGCRS